MIYCKNSQCRIIDTNLSQYIIECDVCCLQTFEPHYVGEDEFWTVGDINTNIDMYKIYMIRINIVASSFGVPKLNGLVVDICYMPASTPSTTSGV